MSMRESNEPILEQDDEERAPLTSKQENRLIRISYGPLTASTYGRKSGTEDLVGMLMLVSWSIIAR